MKTTIATLALISLPFLGLAHDPQERQHAGCPDAPLGWIEICERFDDVTAAVNPSEFPWDD